MDDITITIKASPELIDGIVKEVLERASKITSSNNDSATYSVNDVAKMTNSHPRTVQNHIKSGLLTACKRGKSWIITSQNLNNYIYGQQSEA